MMTNIITNLKTYTAGPTSDMADLPHSYFLLMPYNSS